MNSRGKSIIPKDSILNRDIFHLAEWLKYLKDKDQIDLNLPLKSLKKGEIN